MWVKLLFSTVKKYRIFSLVTDTIYIFTVAKQGFFCNFGTGIFYQKVLSEGYLSEITLRMLWRQHQTWWRHRLTLRSASLHVTPTLRHTQKTFFKCWFLTFHSWKYDSKPFSRCTLCWHPMLYPINTLQKSNRTRNDQGKSKVVLCVFPLSIK